MDGNDITVGMISLGCSKNQVDAERMAFALLDAGFRLGEPEHSDVVIVNTCAFIEDAKKESIEAIFEMSAHKERGNIKGIVTTGCLPERYRQEFVDELPEADAVLGIGRNSRVVEAVKAVLDGKRLAAFGEKDELSLEGGRVLANAPWYAYLKIAEGCENRCSYCAIPDIRGRFRSRPSESILAEAAQLAASGVRELNLIAQDTTRYGEDISGKSTLPELLERLCELEGVRWIRVLYCYPNRITDELLTVMREQPKVVPYMDLPFQHASGRILAAMNRSGDEKSLLELCKRIRDAVPEITLRTTFITGFPGESDEDFETLCEFVKSARFERLGCFAYSREEDTPAYDLPGQLDDDTKARRAGIVMELQAGIAEEIAREAVGSELEVLCEGFDGERGMWYGRSAADAPDIDTRVYFTGGAAAGEFFLVRICGSEGYDLLGQVVSPMDF